MRMLRVWGVVAAIALVFSALSGVALGVKPPDTPGGGNAAVQEQVAALEALVETLDGQVAALEANLNAETAARLAADAQLQANLEAEAATRVAADAELAVLIRTAQTSIATNSKDIDTQTVRVVSNKEHIIALEATDRAIRAHLAELVETDVSIRSDLQTEVEDRQAADTAFDRVATELRTALSDLEGTWNDLKVEVRELQSAVKRGVSGFAKLVIRGLNTWMEILTFGEWDPIVDTLPDVTGW